MATKKSINKKARIEKSETNCPVKIIPAANGIFTHAMYVNNVLFSDEVGFDYGEYQCVSDTDHKLILPLRIKDIPDNLTFTFYDMKVCREIHGWQIGKQQGIFKMEFWITNGTCEDFPLNFRKFIGLMQTRIIETEEITTNPAFDATDKSIPDDSLTLIIQYMPKCKDTTTLQELTDRMSAFLKPIYYEVIEEILNEDKDFLQLIKHLIN